MRDTQGAWWTSPQAARSSRRADDTGRQPCCRATAAQNAQSGQFRPQLPKHHSAGLTGDRATPRIQGTVSSSDGFSGHFATPVTYTESADGASWSTTPQLNQSLGNGTGQRVVIHSLLHVKVENQVTTFSVEKTHLACVGKPAP